MRERGFAAFGPRVPGKCLVSDIGRVANDGVIAARALKIEKVAHLELGGDTKVGEKLARAVDSVGVDVNADKMLFGVGRAQRAEASNG